MRTESEVLTQILDFANNDDKVRAVILNGSRVNPNVTKDIFCDYDVVFSVTDPHYYVGNQTWIKKFGELIIMQQNDCIIGGMDKFIFLMQFTDGIRIDLSFDPIEAIGHTVTNDSLTRVLLDKDNIINQFPEPNDSAHFVIKPTEEEFQKLLNNSWWIQTYVAKGIWRDEYPLVRYMHDVIIQNCIVELLSLYVGIQHDWRVNVGKCGKWLKKHISDDLYREFLSTYSGEEYEQIWEALFNTGKLLRKVGTIVAQELGYTYPIQEDINATRYIKKIKALKKDATDFT